MGGRDSPDPPLEAAAGAAGQDVTETFGLLGNETRLAILLALWEAYEPFAEGTWDPFEGNAVSFSELRDRVGLRQGAQFNYHLDKLVGRFVRKTDDGYELLPAGNEIVRTVIGIADPEDEALEQAEIDLPCPICGAPTAITYRDQRLYRVCTGCDGYMSSNNDLSTGLLLGALANPAGLRNRTPGAAFAAVRTKIFHDYALRVAGICPQCSGRVETRLHVCGVHDTAADEPCTACGRRYDPAVRFVCTVCKHWNETGFVEVSTRHPAVAAFCWEHGIELGYDSRATAGWLANVFEKADQELVSRDPLRVRVTIRFEGDVLRLTLDEDLNVVDVTRTTE